MTSRSGTPGAREVLCVAYFFPPLGGVSVARMTAFIRHLPESGWQPIVLAPSGTTYPLRDPAGLAALPPELEVIRARSPEPHALRRHAERLRAPLAWARSGSVSDAVTSPSAQGAVVVSGSHGGRMAELRRRLFFPDDQLGWVPLAAAVGIRRMRRRPADVIFSSAFPISAHLVAGAIHRATGIPWVAEFRDPWVDNVLALALPSVHRSLQRRIERWIVARASRVVLVTPGLTSAFAARYPAHAGRMRTVMNGYDPSELAGEATEPSPDDAIRLVYTGTLDRPRETVAFLEGLERFVASRPEARDRLRVELIGRRSPEVEEVARPFTAEDRLGSVLSLVNFVPRHEALERVGSATAALVMLGAGPGMDLFVSGKLFDYIGLDRPVLAMVPRGDARDVLEGLGWGIVAEPDPASVAAALDRLWSGDYRRGRADPNSRYDRRGLTRELAAVLDEAATAS